MFQHFHHRPAKIKFAMELKRKRSASSPSPSLVRSPAEKSPIGMLFNDMGIQALLGEVKYIDSIVRNGKRFLISIQRLMNNSPEKGAKDIYDKACQVWEYEQRLMARCTYAIDKEPSFSDTLVAYANHDAPEQRMASMMKDPWLDYILGDRVLGRRQSDAFIRGFLSILIAYWNMKDLLDKYHVSDYGRRRVSAHVPPSDEKYECLSYAVDHFQDFQNLKEVLDSKYGRDPDLVARLFEQISDYQRNGMDLADKWKSGRRAMIEVVLLSIDSGPPSLCESFSFWNIP